MKYILAFCFAAISATAFCQPGSNDALVQKLFSAINNHDSTAVASFFADTARLESPNWEGVQTGKQAVTTIYSRYFKGTPDLHYTITNIIATANAAVVEYTFEGTFSNPEGGSPEYMKDKHYSLKGCTRFNIAGNQITASISYLNQVAFLRQVGFFDQH